LSSDLRSLPDPGASRHASMDAGSEPGMTATAVDNLPLL
jgi:hypothetical protein